MVVRKEALVPVVFEVDSVSSGAVVAMHLYNHHISSRANATTIATAAGARAHNHHQEHHLNHPSHGSVVASD